MAFWEKPEVRELLSAARAIRTYCMLTGRNRERTDELIDALAPFDGDAELIEPKQLIRLRKSMRDACSNIDEYTLTQVLAGNPPIWIGDGSRRPKIDEASDTAPQDWFKMILARLKSLWPKIWQRVLLPSLAVVLLILAMHFTQWSFKANLTITQIDRHISTDVHEEVRDLIVVARAIEVNQPVENQPITSTPAKRLFSQTMSKLRSYHHHEGTLNLEMIEQLAGFNPIVATQGSARDLWANLFGRKQIAEGNNDSKEPTQVNQVEEVARSAKEEVDKANENAALGAERIANALRKLERQTQNQLVAPKADSTQEPTQASVTPSQIAPRTPADLEGEDVMELVEFAIAGHRDFKEVVNLVAKETGRDSGNAVSDHVLSRLILLKQVKRMQDKISLVNRFALPMIYGSLGAALFCLIRVLTPALSDLGPARAFLRVLFGAFSAMTLSMLFIPANVFSINAQSNPTVIFLACFLFGYSFDAVLSALHRLEAFLQGRLKTPEIS